MFRRLYHISCVAYSMKKQAMKLNKMINPRSKRQWYTPEMFESNLMPSVKSLTKVKYQPGKQGVRRLAMLNKLFMKSITDLMSTGTAGMEIVGRGIEVSKVQVTPDFLTVNVFWVCKGQSTDDETEVLLNRIAGALRHELSTLRVMGEVPYIVFVKDKQEAQLVDLDRRLAVADYGEDFTPTEMGHILKTEFTLDTKLSPEMKAKIKRLEDELELTEEPIPEMTHQVFGLEHDKIMNRLVAARKRTKDAWSNIDAETSPVISYRALEGQDKDVDNANPKQELADFLMKRKILQNKLYKQLRASRVDWQAAGQDADDSHASCEEFSDDEEFDDDDTYFYDGGEQLKQARRDSSELD